MNANPTFYFVNRRAGNIVRSNSRPVIRLLPRCCTPVTRRRAATCSLMVMQEICDNEEIGFEGGRYASTEEELYEKAIALLEMCKIETRNAGQNITEPTAESRQ